MTRDEIFESWAPAGSTWSGWVKPALFAHLPRQAIPTPPPPVFDVSWAPPVAERFALVIDLPGGASVACGLALAEIGYRPIPLFNAIPQPAPREGESPIVAAVDVEPILSALQDGADRFRSLSIPQD